MAFCAIWQCGQNSPTLNALLGNTITQVKLTNAIKSTMDMQVGTIRIFMGIAKV